MTDEMKPCPLCQAELRIYEGEGSHASWQHPRTDCILGGLIIYQDKHITAWNTRSPAAGGEDVGGDPCDWPPLKMALWRVLMDEQLNDGHYIKALELIEKLHNAARPLSSDTGDGAAVEYERGWKEAVEVAAKILSEKADKERRKFPTDIAGYGAFLLDGAIEAIRALPTPTAPSISKRSV